MADDTDSSERGSTESLIRESDKPIVNVQCAPVHAANIIVEPGGEAWVGHKIEVTVERSKRKEDLEKLHKETRNRIKQSCPHGFVKTSAFHLAVQMLKEHGIVVIRGRPGDGRTEFGYQLLEYFRRHEKAKPLALKRPRDWKCVDTSEKQTIFIDDMFGGQRDDWFTELKQCTPGRKEKVKFVITTEPYLYKPKRHGLFKTAPTIDTFNLSQEEKESFLRTFAQKGTGALLTPDEITHAAKIASPLGFPLACWIFFQERENGKTLALDFFEHPLEHYEDMLKEMAEEGNGRFQVLVLAMLHEGQLCPDNETIKQMDAKKLSLAAEFSKEKSRSAADIGRIAKELKDRYFNCEKPKDEKDRQEEGKEEKESQEKGRQEKGREEKDSDKTTYTFLHKSIYELVFKYVFEIYKEESVELAPFELVNKYMRTKRSTEDDVRIVDKKSLLARLKSELLDGNFSALGHPSLHKDKDFESHFAEVFCGDKRNVSILLSLRAPATYMDVCLDNYTMTIDANKPLSFKHMTGGHLMKTICETTHDSLCHIASLGLPTFTSKVVEQAPKASKQASKMTAALVYASAAGDLGLCKLLISKDAKPQIQTAQAACCGKDDNAEIMEELLKKFKVQKVKEEEIDACCRIAVQHGHARMLESTLRECPKTFSPKMKNLYHCCLLQCHGRYVDHSSDHDKSKEVFDVLRRNGARTYANPNRDLLIAAGHRSWSIGETLLADRAVINCQHGEDKYTPLHVALRYGGIEVVQELLKKGPSNFLDIRDVKGHRPLHWLGIELGKQIRSGYQSRTDHLMKVLETVLREHNPAVEMSDLLSKPDNKGHTPLHYIFGEMEEEDIFLVLLERKSAESYDKKTISTNLCKMVELLQDNVVDASSTRDGQKRTLLHTYVSSPYCQQEVLQSLLHFYRDINMKDKAKRTPLHVYMSQGMVTPDTVDFFLNNGADVDCTDEDGMTPWMHYARRVDVHKDIVGKFLDKKINLALTDKNKRTILHLYCSSENAKIDLLTEMIDKGADVKARDSQGRTALMTLCDSGNVPTLVVKTLIKRGCPVNLQDNKGKTALIWLCSNPIGFKEEVLKVLLQKNADADIVDQSSQTPLRAYVSSQPKVEGRVISLLLEHMKQADVPDANGCTVLHLLAASGCATEENISALMEAKKHQISPVAVDKNKCTALHLACSHRPKLEVIKKLIRHMPKPDKKDKEGKSALHFTTDKEDKEGQTALHATTDKVDSNGQTALHVYHSGWWPVEKAVVESLLDAGIEVNKKDKKGRTALHLYCQTARQVSMDIDQDVVICHMKHGFDPSSTDEAGSPALMCSIS